MRIRQARAGDWGGVKPFCTRTFEWGDYIEKVWDRWVSDGNLLAYENDTGVVDGIGHFSVRQDEAWIDGIRVRPSARRRGTGSALVAEAEQLSSEMGAVQARAAIESTNAVSLKMFHVRGYKREWDWHMYSCESGAGGCGRVRPAPAGAWPSRYVESWRWVRVDERVPPDRVAWADGGPVAVLADSQMFPGVLMVTISHDAEPDSRDAACLIDYAADLAHRAGREVEIFSTHPLEHPLLAAKKYLVRVAVKDL